MVLIVAYGSENMIYEEHRSLRVVMMLTKDEIITNPDFKWRKGLTRTIWDISD